MDSSPPDLLRGLGKGTVPRGMTTWDYLIKRVHELEDALAPFAQVGGMISPCRMDGVTVRPEWLREAHKLLNENSSGEGKAQAVGVL